MQIENERYRITFCYEGGEMTAFLDKHKNIQYLWQGDSLHWSGKNPTLFPLIGNTYDKQYTIDGKQYAMENHGLIRKSILKVRKQTQNSITFALRADAKTLQKYPFLFHYEITYTLINNKVSISYQIQNLGKTTMPFSFGLHPGFQCPLHDNERFEDYVIHFSNPQHAQLLCFDPLKQVPYTLKEQTVQDIPCDYQLIEKYATLIYLNLKCAYVYLLGKKGNGIKMSIAGYPYFAIWTAHQGAPFICLEPWYGHGDFSDVKKDFDQREGTMKLSPNKIFTTSYTIEVF